MIKMTIVFSARSTNGRWGVDVVSATPVQKWPARGALVPLGRTAGVWAFRFDADESAASWVFPVEREYAPVEGATLAWSSDLQSGRVASVLVLGPTAVLRWRGYKGRSGGFELVREGRIEPLPPGIALALGLVEPGTAPEPIPAPPEPSGALQDALQDALRRERS